MARSGLLIIFTRTPVAGESKTRLIPVLGNDGAVRLHEQLLTRTVNIACQSDFASCEIHVWPDTKHDFLQQLSVEFAIGMHAQKGDNLGERMSNAVSSALEQHDFVAITGCDIPLLDLSVLNDAHAILMQQQVQAVLGPCLDGGYYLIGMDRSEPAIFQGIQWGGPGVAAQTRKALKARGLSWQEIKPLWDVDMPADLEKLRHCYGFEFQQDIPVPDRDIADPG